MLDQQKTNSFIQSFFIVATYPYHFCWTYSQYTSNTELNLFVFKNNYIVSSDGKRFLKIENEKDVTFTTIESEASKVELEYTDVSTNFRIKHNSVYVRHNGYNSDSIYCEAETEDPLFKNYSTWIFIPDKIDDDHEFVIAKLHEDISWTRYLPGRVTVYDKSNGDIRFKHRGNIQVLRTTNTGREAHTYLYHIIINIRDKTLTERTTFLQADPFPHSPNILELCCMSKDYEDVQSLSAWYTYTKEQTIPDAETIKRNLRYLNGAKIAYYPMRNDGRFKTYEDGGWNCRHNAYKNLSDQDLAIVNPIQHFYNVCGLQSKIKTEFLMIISALFSVKKKNILAHPLSVYNTIMQYLLRSNDQGGFEVYVLERVWYTLFSLDSET